MPLICILSFLKFWLDRGPFCGASGTLCFGLRMTAHEFRSQGGSIVALLSVTNRISILFVNFCKNQKTIFFVCHISRVRIVRDNMTASVPNTARRLKGFCTEVNGWLGSERNLHQA